MKGSHAVVLAFGPKLCLDAYKNSPPEFRLSFSSILIAIVTRVSTSTSTSTSTSSNDDDEEEDYDIDDDTALSSGHEWVHYYYELFGALASFSAFVGMVALLVDGKWWLWTTYKSRPHLSMCPLMMISIPPYPAPDLVTTPTPFLPPLPPVPGHGLLIPVAGLASAQSQQQHQKKKKKTQKKKAGESKPPWRV
ncbi:hypothetical protein CI102_15336 [Trichoderma harzianum]|nr:hypothetical protein CI102_15336 [Trichoderma harzianum]